MIQCDGFNIDWVKADDANGITSLMNKNAEALQNYFPGTLAANRNAEDSRDFIANISEDIKTKKQFLFSLKVTTQVIGLVYIKELDWDKKEGEFAYCIDANYGRKGWMTQAVSELSAFAFANHDLELLKIIVHHTNIPSIKVAQHSGFKFIKTLKNEYTPPNSKPMDMELYELRKQ